MVNLEQYKKICIACDRVLNAASDNDEIISMPILHVIREHPEFLKKYGFIYSANKNLSPKSKNIFIFLTGIFFFNLIFYIFFE